MSAAIRSPEFKSSTFGPDKHQHTILGVRISGKTFPCGRFVQFENNLPQWFLLQNSKEIIGGCGLITNDFISRMDLYPWLCALYVEEKYRHQGCGGKLIEHASLAATLLGYENLYCCTDHIGYYEKCRFEYIGIGYHPWDENSRIYRRCLKNQGRGL